MRTARPKVISPSRLARYYFLECDRYLRYSSTQNSDLTDEGVPETARDESPATEAILEAGYLWEEEVVGKRLAGRVRIAPGSSDFKLRDHYHNLEQTRDALAKMKPGEFLYQPTLRAVPEFYNRYGIDPSRVIFADCRPDLIQLFETPHGLRWRIIDIKASPGLKISHRVQAAFYAMMFEPLLAEWDLSHAVDSSHRHPACAYQVDSVAGIWLGNENEPTPFDIRHLRPVLNAFLSERLEKVISSPAIEADWHFAVRCEWCLYVNHCRKEMRQTDDVSRLQMITGYSKRHLRSLEPPIRTVAELDTLLADNANSPKLEGCASLEGKANRLRSQTHALTRGETQPYGGSTLALPPGENVRLVMTLNSEPVTRQLYSYGILAQGLKDVLGSNPPPLVGVAANGQSETVLDLERNFVREVHRLLSSVDSFNRRWNDAKSQKSLQTYVFDSYERERLNELLLRRIDDPDVGELATALFFHFQQPDLLHADSQPGEHVHFPSVVIVEVISRLLALPFETNIRLADVAPVLQPEKYAYDYSPDARFAFAISNQMRSEPIRKLWEEGDQEQKIAIERELTARLRAANSVLDGVRHALMSVGLAPVAWLAKFRLPAGSRYRFPLLSRLAFIIRFEMGTRYVEVRSARVAPLADRIRSGNALRVTSLGGDRFRLDPTQAEVNIDLGSFPNWLVHFDTPDGHRAAQTFNDFAARNRSWVSRTAPLALGAVEARSADQLRLKLIQGQAMPPINVGDVLIISQRFTDFTSEHVETEFSELDQEESPEFVRFIEDPHGANTANKLTRTVRQTAIELATRHGMTPSQIKAFEGMLDTRLRLVWGPPGTGKTHFLALAILCLAEANRTVGLRLRVLLTGFTHASIDNCLKKIVRLQTDFVVCKADMDVGKIGGDCPGVTAVPDSTSGTWLTQRSFAVLGGTVWAIRKGVPPACAEAVIIDEGSQFRVPESSIAIRRLSRNGRLIVAGDDRQLPPIIAAEYPPPPSGQPIVHRSLFECLRTADPDERYTSTLLENWRMNDVLCRYPAEQVYVPEYRSATDAVATRRLRLAVCSEPIDPLADLILEPAYPLVVVVVDGIRATAENRIEAGLVARVVERLRQRLLKADEKPYQDDRNFWAQGVFVVCPHHVQIAAVRRELARLRGWTSTPFVDTVDKMQGQECDAVIVSYGVADLEYALAEKEFIYSMNRLNVAITRARSKSIVILSRPLLEPPLAAFESDDVAAGVGFMRGLVSHAATGVVNTENLNDGIRLTIYRKN